MVSISYECNIKLFVADLCFQKCSDPHLDVEDAGLGEVSEAALQLQVEARLRVRVRVLGARPPLGHAVELRHHLLLFIIIRN